MKSAFSGRFWILAAIFVAALQSAVLLYVVASRAAVLRNGAEVLLRTVPIDPRDLLRGDYVVLNYDISRIPAALFQGDWPQTKAHHSVYARLKAGADGYWTVAEASFAPLSPQAGTVVIAGTTGWIAPAGSNRTVAVNYGIERYYVPEGEGRAIESARNEERVGVALRVSSDGVAHIRALLLDGRPLYEEPLY